MATLKQIAERGSELHAAFLMLESYRQDRQTAQDRLQAVNALIQEAAARVDLLKAAVIGDARRMTGAGQLNTLVEKGLYGNDRLRVNSDLLQQAYLAKAAQAARELDPREAATYGLYTDQGPPQGYLEQYLSKLPGTQDKAQQIPGLLNLNPNSKRIDPRKEWKWLDKSKPVKG